MSANMTGPVKTGLHCMERAGITLSMTCDDWDRLAEHLAGVKGEPYQGVANAILIGLINLDYYRAAP